MFYINALIFLSIILVVAPTASGDFAGDVLKRHNELRAVHSSPSLSLSNELSEKAEKLAKQAAADGKFPKNISGANTEMICSSFKRAVDDGVQVTDQWYNKTCDKNKPSTAPSFVRMIQKNTKFIGIGKASNENTKQPCTFIVALYDPKGDETSIRSHAEDPYAKEALSAHNFYRRLHKVPKMTLNSEMSQQAAACAQQLSAEGRLRYSTIEERHGQGENVAYQCDTPERIKNLKGSTPVLQWYSDVCEPGHSFAKGSQHRTGALHFTQIIWKESTQLGIGKATAQKYGLTCVYTVARYQPMGNMLTKFDENVFKGRFKKRYCRKIMKKLMEK